MIKFLGMRTLTDRETDDLMKLGRFNAQSEKYPKMWPKTRKMLEVGAAWGGGCRPPWFAPAGSRAGERRPASSSAQRGTARGCVSCPWPTVYPAVCQARYRYSTGGFLAPRLLCIPCLDLAVNGGSLMKELELLAPPCRTSTAPSTRSWRGCWVTMTATCGQTRRPRRRQRMRRRTRRLALAPRKERERRALGIVLVERGPVDGRQVVITTGHRGTSGLQC